MSYKGKVFYDDNDKGLPNAALKLFEHIFNNNNIEDEQKVKVKDFVKEFYDKKFLATEAEYLEQLQKNKRPTYSKDAIEYGGEKYHVYNNLYFNKENDKKCFKEFKQKVESTFHDYKIEVEDNNNSKTANKTGTSSIDSNNPSEPRQIIYFGAPGTSKSFTLKNESYKLAGVDIQTDSEEEAREKVAPYQERVTFYPGYSHQQFVGTYKPYMDGDKISYKFVPGPLIRLLEKALKAEKAKPQDKNKTEAPTKENSTENQERDKKDEKPEKFLLIVEELNRAEAAAVFGDFFQLLDRNSDGKSEYPISVSEDLKQYLCRKENENDIGVWADEPKNTQLSFPSNFYIWATMNSADQGVFPLDTAFKRRWDFKYFGINDGKNVLEKGVPKFWNELRETINKALHEQLNLNEDKLLGPFFMKVEENIDEKTFWDRFCSKVLLYLYEDAARLNRKKIFRDKTYSAIYKTFKDLNKDNLETKWKEVFTFEIKLGEGGYPFENRGTEKSTSSDPNADDKETAGESVTGNDGDTTDEQ